MRRGGEGEGVHDRSDERRVDVGKSVRGRVCSKSFVCGTTRAVQCTVVSPPEWSALRSTLWYVGWVALDFMRLVGTVVRCEALSVLDCEGESEEEDDSVALRVRARVDRRRVVYLSCC